MSSGYLSEIFVSFQGEGLRLGERHLFIRSAGCNLRCRYCDTPASLLRTESCLVHNASEIQTLLNPIGIDVIIPAIRAVMAEAGPLDALSLTGGEPLAQAGFLRSLVEELAPGVPILLETNGVLPDQLRRLIDVVDIVSMDIKPPSSSGERAFWAEHEEFLRIARAKEVYVKVVVDRLTALADIARAAEIVSQVSDKIVFFLQPMMDDDDRPMISGAALGSYYNQARRHLSRVRIAPQVHKLLKIQ